MRCNQCVHTARRAGQIDARIGDRCAHRAGRYARQIHQRHTPPMMHQLQCNTQEYLDDQIHHDVHDTDVDEHVGDEAPGLIAPKWIVDEKRRCRTTRVLAQFLVVVHILSGNMNCGQCGSCSGYFVLLYSLEIDNVNQEHDDFQYGEYYHRQRWWT